MENTAKGYKAYFSVRVCAADEKEAMSQGFDYLRAFFGDDDEVRLDTAEVAFDRAEVIQPKESA